MTDLNATCEKLRSRDATVGIIGLGYVGLPLALRFVAVGGARVSVDFPREFSCLLEVPLDNIPGSNRIRNKVQQHQIYPENA